MSQSPSQSQSSGIHEMYPYVRVRGGEAAIAFYETVFGAVLRLRLNDPDGRVGHAELVIGDGVLMLSDEYPEYDICGPESIGGASSSIHLHVEDTDALMARAVAAGATVIREAKDQFYGERSGAIRDPFGQEWLIGHHIEDVSPAEMQRRFDAMYE